MLDSSYNAKFFQFLPFSSYHNNPVVIGSVSPRITKIINESNQIDLEKIPYLVNIRLRKRTCHIDRRSAKNTLFL